MRRKRSRGALSGNSTRRKPDAGVKKGTPRIQSTMNLSMGIRLLLALGLLAGIHGVAYWGGVMGGLPILTSVPSRDFQELPMQLGPWRGEDQKTDPELMNIDHSYASVRRVYRNPRDDSVQLYGAVFTDISDSVAPHPPDFCFPAAGYEVVDTSDIRIPVEKGTDFSARLLMLRRDGRTEFALFWFQVPGTTYVESYGHRKQFWSYRGQDTKPAVVKILLQASAQNSKQTRKTLEDLAVRIHRWVNEYQAGEQEIR